MILGVQMKPFVFAILLVFSTSSFAKSASEHCADGASSALKQDAAIVGLICAADFLLAAGLSGACLAAATEAVIDVPLSATVGCAVSATFKQEGQVYETAQAIGTASDVVDTAQGVGQVLSYVQ